MRHRLTNWGIALLCVLVLAACGSNTSRAGKPTITPTSLASAGTISATITGLGALTPPFTSDANYAIAADESAVWVHNGQTGNLLRIDPQTNMVVATIAVGAGAGGVALGQGAVWVVSSSTGTIVRVDPLTNRVTATIAWHSTDKIAGLAVSPGAVWLTDFSNDALIRIDSQTNKIVATLPNFPGIVADSFADGSVWTCNHHSNAQGLVRVDAQTNQVQAQINPASDNGFCAGVVALPGAVWTMSYLPGESQSTRVERIDPATNRLSATIPLPDLAPFQLAADGQGVWDFSHDSLYRIDPTTNRAVGVLAMQPANALAVGAGSVWVAKYDGTLVRITPAL